MVLGNTSTSELYALRRVSFSDHLVTSMKLPLTSANLQVKVIYLHPNYGSPSALVVNALMQIRWTVYTQEKQLLDTLFKPGGNSVHPLHSIFGT